MIWLHFPRLVQDAAYLYRKLQSVIPDPNEEAFAQAFRALSRPELVHVFEPRNGSEAPAAKGLKKWFGK